MLPDRDVFLRTLYGAVTDDDSFRSVLERLAQRYDCPSAVLIYADVVRPELEVAFSYGTFGDPANQERYFRDYRDDDPAPQVMRRLRVGEAGATDRLFTDEFKNENRFITQFYYPLGLRETLGGPFLKVDGRFGILAVHRGANRPAFSDDDISDFQILMPHFANAIELRASFFERSGTVSSLENVFDNFPAGVMIFDQRRSLLRANTMAREIMNQKSALWQDASGQITLADPDANKQLRAIFAKPQLASPHVVIRAKEGITGGAYAIRVSSNFSDKLNRWEIILHVSEPGQRPRNLTQELVDAFGMTIGAAQLTSALLNGDSISSFATAEGISINTVKYHLKSAFRTMDAHTQKELVHVAALRLRDLGFSA